MRKPFPRACQHFRSAWYDFPVNHEAMDADTVAGLLDVSTRQLRNYCNLGCPYDERERKRYFDWPKVLAWYVAFKSGGVPAEAADGDEEADEPGPGRKENQTQANLRKTRAEADLKQLVLAQKRGQVIGIDEARQILDRMFGNLKAQLLSAAPLLNTQLEGEADSIAREAAIRLFMEQLCQELATGKVVREAAAETNDADPETDDEEGETIEDLQASAEDITDVDVDAAVVDFLLANATSAETEL